MENVLIERLWRRVDYAGVLLWEEKNWLPLKLIRKNCFDRFNIWDLTKRGITGRQLIWRQTSAINSSMNQSKKCPTRERINSYASAEKCEEVIWSNESPDQMGSKKRTMCCRRYVGWQYQCNFNECIWIKDSGSWFIQSAYFYEVQE